jgi:hypothetical protein
MNFIPEYSDEEKRLHKASKHITIGLFKIVAKTRFEWLASNAEKIMPPEVFALVHGKKIEDIPLRDQNKIRRWMTDNNVRICEYPDRATIMRGDEVISEFRVTTKDGKIEVMTRDVKPKA